MNKYLYKIKDLEIPLWIKRWFLKRSRGQIVEVEGIPPLIFQSNGRNLLDYRIDGASGGVGDRTNNLFDLKKAVKKKYINSNGDEATSFSPSPENALNHSDYVSIDSNVNYTFTCNTSQNYSLANTIALCWFDQNKNILSRNTMDVRGNINNYSITALSPSTAKYLIVNFIAYVDDAVFYLNEGTTTVFEPYGYKVPVIISGKNLLKPDGTPTTIRGVSWSYREDGAVVGERVSSNENVSDFTLINSSTFKPGSYIFSRFDTESTPGSSTYQANILINGVSHWGTGNYLFVLNEPSTIKVVLRVYPNFTGKAIFKPMIRLSSIQDSNYEAYIEPTTTNIYLDEPIEANESISLSDTNVPIPTLNGTNILTVDTTVQPSKVYIKTSTRATRTNLNLQMKNLYNENQPFIVDSTSEIQFSKLGDGEYNKEQLEEIETNEEELEEIKTNEEEEE